MTVRVGGTCWLVVAAIVMVGAGLRPQGAGWCLGLAGVSLGILFVPLDGLPLARCLAGLVDHWSLPLLALLAAAVVRQLLGVELLRPRDRLAAQWFGLVAGLFLYPMAVGWGPFDPYGLGWHFGPLFAAVGLLASLLLWRRNRFGIVLVLAILAWHLGVTESGNYWDCLMDPFYFLISVGMISGRAVSVACRWAGHPYP